jgi:hypothetical protein
VTTPRQSRFVGDFLVYSFSYDEHSATRDLLGLRDDYGEADVQFRADRWSVIQVDPDVLITDSYQRRPRAAAAPQRITKGSIQTRLVRDA